MIPSSNAPLIRLATRAAVTTNPMAKINKGHVRKFGAMVTMTPWPCFATPAFTKPMNAMNSPIPIPIDRLRSIGMAFSTASRKPVRTSTEMIRPSVTITPMASGQVRCAARTSVNATNAFSPRPAANANG